MEIINNFVDNYKEQIIETLQKTIQIPSYEREPMEGMPPSFAAIKLKEIS